MSEAPTEQERFDAEYITSSEICHRLDVKRSTVVIARQRGALPEPIVINGCQIHIWKRDIVTPYLEEWERKLNARRGIMPA